VYKALQKTLAAAQPTNSIPTAAAAAALADRLNLLGYLNSIASCAEVANVVLNTSFLTLLLKIMKNNTLYSAHTPGSRSAAGSNAAVNLAATMNVHSLQGRVWAATVLAVMLRFVSDLKPPTIRTREDHIVPSIVAILRDPGKLDVRLKRRAVAALGETVFYISAQTEEVGVERWSLPPQAVEALVDCLREENDEVVKHYAVKVSNSGVVLRLTSPHKFSDLCSNADGCIDDRERVRAGCGGVQTALCVPGTGGAADGNVPEQQERAPAGVLRHGCGALAVPCADRAPLRARTTDAGCIRGRCWCRWGCWK
jgi:hypothetical protein